ncbi:MAG: tetraacyldisaccharide 4'-kinase [Rhodospirillales bacterium]
MKSPAFWRPGMGGALALALAPAGCLYGMATALRLRFGRTTRPVVPVICVGNLVAGGAGKTPVVIDLVARLRSRGVNVHVLTRGYGGTVFGPHLVNEADGAADVGDEALLLARTAPTWVADDRSKGCRHAVQGGAEAIILDDGFQDPSVAKDLSLVVVDGGFGFGNGYLIPAGPLREPVHVGLRRADAMVVIGGDQHNVAVRAPAGVAVARVGAALDPVVRDLADRRVLAFAGIGRPDKFFDALADAGLTLAETRGFPDHHPYSPAELQRLQDDAALLDAVLVTTEKDLVRLSPADRHGIVAAPLILDWADEAVIEGLLDEAMNDGR